MNFERSDILKQKLDDLSANDSTLFWSLQQKVLGQMSARGMAVSSASVSLVFQAIRDEITQRAQKIVSEISRVLDGASIPNCDELSQQLKAELSRRLDAATHAGSIEFENGTESIRRLLNHPNMPTRASLMEHTETVKQSSFAEIDLFCQKLQKNQAPSLFLHAGEVFGGNRAARAIFSSATQSLDIIDTYYGPAVFDMLELTLVTVRIRLISDKADSATRTAFRLFNQQYQNRVEFRLCPPKSIHDRFIIIDGIRALHIGHSIKDLGKSDTLIDQADSASTQKRFDDLWQNSQPVV
jgi:hypothetical protein